MDILEYCEKEWRGNTPVAKRMRKVYFLLSDFTGLFISVFHKWLSTQKVFKTGKVIAIFFSVVSLKWLVTA